MVFEVRENELRFNQQRLVECFRIVNDTIGRILGAGQPPVPGKLTGQSAALFHAPRLGWAAYNMLVKGNAVSDKTFVEAYFADVPSPRLFRDLDDSDLSRFIDWFGPDIMRANFLSEHLVDKPHHRPLLSGGACALETWATRLLGKPLLVRSPALRRAVLLHLLDSAPYYTHITGAMMLGANARPQIMYDETFPWFMAIHDIGATKTAEGDAWTLTRVRDITRELYDRIYNAVVRRSGLISSDIPEILRVPFEDLKLHEAGHLERWYRKYIDELPDTFSQYIPKHYQHDKFIGAYVRYTYVGPDLLELVKSCVSDSTHNIDERTIHVRTKQDDHLYEGRRINRILLNGADDNDHAFLSKYANICNLAIYFWHQRHWRTNNGFAGFSDLSFRGNIVHDTIDLSTGCNTDIKTDEKLWDIVNCPLRLNRNNITEHFECLDKYVDTRCVYAESAHIIEQLKQRLDKHAGRIASVSERVEERRLVQRIMAQLSTCKKSADASAFIGNSDLPGNPGVAGQKQLTKALSGIANRYRRKARVAELPDSELLLDRFAASMSIDCSTSGVHVRLRSPGPELHSLLPAIQAVIQNEIDEYRIKKDSEHRLMSEARRDYLHARSTLKHVGPVALDTSGTRPDLLPLRNNLLVCHAIQLAFDPNIALFLLDAEQVESSHMSMHEKRLLLVRANRQILPRIKHYLRLVMSETPRAVPLTSLDRYSPVYIDHNKVFGTDTRLRNRRPA